MSNYLTSEFNNSENIPSLLQQFEIQFIKNISESIFQNLETKKHGLLVHERLAKALKINTYFRISLKKIQKFSNTRFSYYRLRSIFFILFTQRRKNKRGSLF